MAKRFSWFTISENCLESAKHQGSVVWKPINSNPRLKINQGIFFLHLQTLFDANILQNIRLVAIHPEKQKAATETFTQKLINATRVYANPVWLSNNRAQLDSGWMLTVLSTLTVIRNVCFWNE